MQPLTGLILLHVGIICLMTDGVCGVNCFECVGRQYAGDPLNCLVPHENYTAFSQCEPRETFCKKKVVRGGGEIAVERRCYDMCNPQTGVAMGTDVQIDIYCCQGHLCNAAPSQGHDLQIIILGLVSSFISLHLYARPWG